MIKRTLQQVEEMCLGIGLEDLFYDIVVQGISIDSRTIAAGSLYVPIVRVKNGHDYVKEAIRKGAVASLWQNDQPNPPHDFPLIFVDDCVIALQHLASSYRKQLSIKVIAITGSNGKTTTKDMVSSIVETSYKVHKTKGNLNSQIGLPLTLLEIKENSEVVVLELGMSERGQIERLSRIAAPDIAVITMIGLSHLSSLGSREEIAAAKLEIVIGLQSNGVLILNGDEPLLKNGLDEMSLSKSIRIIRIGENNETNDYYASVIQQETENTSFLVNTFMESCMIPILGKHNVLNALASIAVGETLCVPTNRIRMGLAQLKMTGMRMEKVESKAGFTMINDAWNASPVSMKAAIGAFEELKGYSRKFLILGDMLELGECEKQFHREIGEGIDPNKVDYVFTIGKIAQEIAIEATKKFKDADRVKAFQHKKEAISEIRALIRPQDVLLVKGSRGMQLEEIVWELT
ncbi:UDP-N-acetylmuramoyl-tripeptide--D-alanyl-D-alanine ligase [Paenibacillus sp. LMG 31456]|uniref:UDP-N-acetylmuramoyl-tripeptide--D-alanyl-D-alanine ligase n=1 Tax=Paenibacillus foliorum TaxID=2654974 RepID=A0A972GP44_9BACL|nr:UDP-N-acetylmuramoyl-tripeptide--D-alanyl-D-alanine ligase [Paenibacillus foliorum]NOU91814.1 UDP-N-acetylmuramoyl-tripeptide--D-alanyl-D-alanine ligase [Paenibacillus foliorum]